MQAITHRPDEMASNQLLRRASTHRILLTHYDHLSFLNLTLCVSHTACDAPNSPGRCHASPLSDYMVVSGLSRVPVRDLDLRNISKSMRFLISSLNNMLNS